MRESFSPQEIRYLKLLRKQYRTIQEASAEVAHLRAVLRLPKGTEHFLSDLHGEHAAFLHILHNASGVIKRKINDLYGDILSSHERDMLSTLIYYPDEKLALLKKQGVVNAEWYRLTIYRLLEVCRMCSVKYTRKRVRDAMPREMGALMEEMLLSDNTPDKEGYYREVMQSILETGQSDAMIIALSGVIQVLAIDRLHIIGDILRPRAARRPHHGRAGKLPSGRCAVGQPRYCMDGRGGAVRSLHRAGHCDLCEIRQSGNS